jgi:small-conductance mechanosensitive channel
LFDALSNYVHGVWQSTLPTRLTHAILIAVVFEALILLTRWQLRKALRRVLSQDLHRDATMRVLRRRVVLGVPLMLSQTILIVIALLVILRYLGFQVAAELLPVGLVLVVAALVVFRDTLADMAAGYFILYDDLFGVGERISVEQVTGQVMQMGLRRTRLLTNDGREVSLANRALKQVINHSRATETQRPTAP